MTLRAVIVEDEPLAVDRLRSSLANEEGIELVGEAQDGLRAIDLIHRTAPDLVFLDVRLPGCSGFDVLQRLERKPAVSSPRLMTNMPFMRSSGALLIICSSHFAESAFT
jgi:YesN/AraC family two-component response regulator